MAQQKDRKNVEGLEGARTIVALGVRAEPDLASLPSDSGVTLARLVQLVCKGESPLEGFNELEPEPASIRAIFQNVRVLNYPKEKSEESDDSEASAV